MLIRQLKLKLFMTCHQATPVAKATAIQPVPAMPDELLSMPTEPKNLILWPMPSMSTMAGPPNFRQRKTTSTSA